jgi:hypothetical protein
MVAVRRALVAVCVLALWGATLPGAVAGKDKGDVHKPPYKKGVQGGDDFNYIDADRQSGEVSIMRVFPGISPVVGCEPESYGGYASLRVEHHVDAPVMSVVVNYDRATMDVYSFINIKIEDANGKWLASRVVQGRRVGDSGALKVDLGNRSPHGGTIDIYFGLQLSSSCPQVAGAYVHFPSVEVKT